MLFEPLAIEGAFLISIEAMVDDRGFFARSFCAQTFAEHGLVTDFVQRSISYSERAGTLRGLHYQLPPHAETKIVRTTRGVAFDVVVDLRPYSPSYGHWQSVEITADNRLMVYIPAGCAHGVQTLVDHTEVVYEITPAYVPAAARGIRWNDPALAITWPILPPIVSSADGNRSELAAASATETAAM